MDDLGVKYTDKEFIQLERRLKKLYSECEKDIQKQMDVFFAKFKKKNAAMLDEMKGLKGDELRAAQDAYQKWLKGQVFIGKQWQDRKDSISNTLLHTNEAAINMVNQTVPNVFQMNANYAAYEMEMGKGVNFGFNLYDSTVVKEIIAKDKAILPYKHLNKKEDIRWNFQNIKNIVTKGIVKGESVDKIAKNLATEMPNRNMKMVRTHARTMLTSAQNQGRLVRFEDAQDMGIDVKKQWVATLDQRTRETHQELDGQIRDLDEPFEVEGMEIMVPADPHADPSLVYNCRCTMNSVIAKYPNKYTERIARDDEGHNYKISNMTYKEWVNWKEDGDE